jgi:hypothetical protein
MRENGSQRSATETDGKHTTASWRKFGEFVLAPLTSSLIIRSESWASMLAMARRVCLQF